jgi:RNA polymerase sigma factor (sigma-70 family)
VDPEDVVNDVWLASLPRLREFTPEDGHATASLLRYLSVAVLRRVHRLLKVHLATPGGLVRAAPDPDAVKALAELPAETTGVVSKNVRAERHRTLHEAVAELDELDRAVVVSRALEQHSNDSVAVMTGLQPNAVSQRLRRAMAKLRERLPESVFLDLADE